MGAAASGHWNASTRPPARPLCRTTRREGVTCADVMTASLNLARSTLDGFADAHIGATPADIACHRRVDVRVVRMGIAGQQRSRRHDLPGLAVAALNYFEIKPSL